MKLAAIISLLGVLAMAGMIAFALLNADFNAEGSILLGLAWGRVSLVDLYVGFTLFSAWIVFRERSPWAALVWVILMMTLGFFTGALYVFLNLQRSNGDWVRFFLGKRAPAN